MKTIVIGGDGFCGWPSAMHLAKNGHEVLILDNLSRRKIDIELGIESLTPIASIDTRIKAWNETNPSIDFEYLDVANNYERLLGVIKSFEPDNIIHFGEQRSAPYSMKLPRTKVYTVDNNISATHNVLSAIVDSGLDIHLVHLGSMGVYGYSTAGLEIPEGYLDISKNDKPWEVLYPTMPGSVYHMTKSMDQIMFGFYAKNNNLRVTDLHQGVVWGTQTEESANDERLINRFDYCGDYGTVLNRFLMQAAINYPLTVHGSGGQTRAFIHIQDTVKCIKIACDNPPEKGDRVCIRNQLTETHTVKDLAQIVSSMTGAEITYIDNPRKEDDKNELDVNRDSFLELGLNPTTLQNGLLEEVRVAADKYKDRINANLIPCFSKW
jgi:UDP-sulfoquinovose synthase